MITLNLKKEPFWLDLLEGVRLYLRPASTALVMAARVAVQKEDDAATRSVTLITRLAELAILDWEGVGDESGESLPVTTEGIAALMDLWPVAEAFERLYLGPALLLEQEKNA